MLSPTAIAVFLKFPEPGRVKTRLAATVGNDKAVVVYKWLLNKTLQTLGELERDFEVYLYCDAKHPLKSYQELIPQEFHFRHQSSGDLGERLLTANRELYPKFQSVLCIGTDCPALTKQSFTHARALLLKQEADVVLGPTLDGGYYLVGTNKLVEELFVGIEWSTERVLNQTLKAAQEKKLAVSQLEKFRDIDHWEDLKASPQARQVFEAL